MLIDAHAHLDRYEEGIYAALAEIAKHRIFTISTSMNLPSYRRNLEIAARCDLVLPVFGVHPWNASGYANKLRDLDQAIEESPMLGEIGLDHHFVRNADRYDDQRRVFEYFLAAAAEQGKPVNLHTKGAEREVLDLLDGFKISRAIVHWYSGPMDVFSEMVARGHYFTVGVEIMHSDEIRTIAREIPECQLLTETDNPGGIKWLTGEAGMPAVIVEVVDTLAALRGSTRDAIEGAVHSNLIRLLPELSILSP
jgi:TatD DNase family protein